MTAKSTSLKWFYKIVFVFSSKIAEWAMKKAGIEPDQHKKAEEGTERIKNASDKIKDTPVNIDKRDPNDVFNNDTFNK